jgi:formate dehydrogenase major subunit
MRVRLATDVRQNKEGRLKKIPKSRNDDSRLQTSALQERGVENQPFSLNSVEKAPRIRGAQVTHSVCPYCAVGCGQLVYTKAGKIIDIEGNPESPINAGTQCPKGANTFQLTVNPHRIKQVLYRAPYSEVWERRSLDWAMERIAQKLKDARDADFIESRDESKLNHLTTVASLGGATMDNEENYLIKKLFGGGLGIVAIENQARI